MGSDSPTDQQINFSHRFRKLRAEMEAEAPHGESNVIRRTRQARSGTLTQGFEIIEDSLSYRDWAARAMQTELPQKPQAIGMHEKYSYLLSAQVASSLVSIERLCIDICFAYQVTALP